CQQYHSDPYSF
nr:immunoglobulin light chain junction region [Macaca mulatta]